MQIPTINYDQAYVDFCNRNGLAIGVTPKSAKDMGLKVEMIMREEDPYLYQNLCSPSTDNLPADVKLRFQKGIHWVQDVDVYDSNGFTGIAANIRKEIIKAEQQIMEDRMVESQKIQKNQEAERKAFEALPLGHPLKQPTPESIARTRESWGITGRVSWE
mgnify:CR=1 FL=1